MCGYNSGGTIEDCYNTGAVSGSNYAGGVCGWNNRGTIKNCYNTGAVNGSENVGGVCGYNSSGTIEDCYNTGSVSESKYVGGVCGYNYRTIKNCYNTGSVNGNYYVGGVCGYNYRTIKNCYFDSNNYDGGAVGYIYGGTITDVEGKTTNAFVKGEVCYLLQSGESPMVWGQTINIDKAPVLTSDSAKTVYQNTKGCVTYSNTNSGITEKQHDKGKEIDVDNLPGSVTKRLAPVPIDPDTGKPMTEHFMYAKTYTLRPVLLDDTIIDDALPRYADYDTSLYVFADVEYLTETQSIIYDGKVSASDLPSNPPKLTAEPEPFIRDAIVQPYDTKGKLIITWITNFTDNCTLTFGGKSQSIRGSKVADGYYTYHGVIDASLNASHSYTIWGKGVSVTKSFSYIDSNRYLLAGDPQLIAEDSAETWYKIQSILSPLPTLIIGMGDQVDAITDAILRTEQYHMFTEKHSVPIATVRGNHDRNVHFLGHYGFPSNANGANFYFKHNGVLFIAIDTNEKDCDAHIQFIQNALNKNTYKWAILLTHHSLYSTSQAANTAHVKALREGLTDFIVNQTDICMVIAGHEHFLCRTRYPGKMFFTVPTCTGSKYQAADYPEAPWNQVTDDSKVPMYTIMDVSDDEIVLTTYDIDGNLKDTCKVS